MRRLPFLVVFTLLGPVPLQAQDPTPRSVRTGPSAFSASSFAGVMQHDGALLGTARSYRATFGERSVEFLPALGKNAPEAAPWRVTLLLIERGSVRTLDADAHSPGRSHDRQRVDYQWPGIVERYEARGDGLEQSFVFDERPAGTGDLTVTLAVDTGLPRATDGSIAWRNPRGGGVTLGKVTGIDARGQRCRGAVRFVEGGVELSLPAGFVDEAVYPMILDPLIATAIEALPSADCDFPDVAYDDYSSTYCVVWTQFFGGGVTGAVGSVFTSDTLTFGYAFAVNQPGNEDSVRVCNVAGTGVFAMIWVNRGSPGSSISGLAFEPTRVTVTNVFTLWGPGLVSMPVVSGEATVYDDDFLVAWIDDTFGLLGCSIEIDNLLQYSATPIVQIAGGNVAEPAYSKQGGNQGLHVITWVDRPPGQPGWIRAQVLDHDSNLVGPGVWIENGTQNCGWPAVDGDGFRFLVAWEQQEIANPSATDIVGRLITVSGAGVTTVGGALDLVTFPGDLDIAPDVAQLGDKFGLVFMGQSPSAPFFDDSYFKAIASDGTPIGDELRLELTPGTDYVYEHTPRLIGHRAGNPNTGSDHGLVVFADQSITTADSDVGLQMVEAMGAGGTVVDLGGGCGPGGLTAANGPFALGNTGFRCELFGAQPLAIPFLLIGLPGPTQTCGFCTYIQPAATQFVANTAGHASARLVLPGNAGLIGTAIDFQFATFGVPYVGCIQGPGIAASNIVRCTLDY